METQDKVATVMVTCNRSSKLAIALKCYEEQTTLPDYLVIVDNNSTDDTKTVLDNWEKQTKIPHKIIFLNENLGGAGGFYEGMKFVFENIQFDWVMIADDDAYPNKELFRNLKIDIHEVDDNCGCICSKVVFPDGEVQLHHRRLLDVGTFRIKERPVSLECYSHKKTNCDVVSFVGSCFKKNVIQKIGYPKKEFFIWYDDSDFSFRVKRYFTLTIYSNLIYINDTNKSPSLSEKVNWRTFYGIRNRLVSYRECFGWRYYIMAKLKLKFDIIFKHRSKNKELAELEKDAAYAAKKRIMGMNIRYLPKKKVSETSKI